MATKKTVKRTKRAWSSGQRKKFAATAAAKRAVKEATAAGFKRFSKPKGPSNAAVMPLSSIPDRPKRKPPMRIVPLRHVIDELSDEAKSVGGFVVGGRRVGIERDDAPVPVDRRQQTIADLAEALKFLCRCM